MRKLFIIFNPAARGEKSQRLRAFLEKQAGPQVTLAPTRSAGEATRLAAQAATQGYDAIVAAGGDGTINEVVNGLGPGSPPLGVLPLGTVNVFAREFGIPLKLAGAWELLQTGRVRTLDLPAIEFDGRRRHFVQLAGVGFDAHVVRAASWELKKKIGPLSYVVAGLRALGVTHPPIEIVNDAGQRWRGVAVLVGNGRFYGGNFRLFPQAKFDDGLLDVCIFPSTRYLDLVRYGFGILRGAHPQLPDVGYFQAARFSCAPAPGVNVAFEVDGEDAGSGPVNFLVQPGGLRLVAP